MLPYSGARPARDVQYCVCNSHVSLSRQRLTRVCRILRQVPFDRVLGNTHGVPPSILYADINSPLFGQFHQTVSQTAKAGQTSYRLRYRPSTSGDANQPLFVNGYGVELALKRTDYIVIDDREAAKSNNDQNEAKAELDSGDDAPADLRPLSVSEVANLGINAASFIMNSAEPFDTLQKLSQDFPKHSAAISAHEATNEFMQEYRANREAFLPAGYNVMWINGIQVHSRQFDAFSFLTQLRQERALINSLRSIGLSGTEAVQLLSHNDIAHDQVSAEPQRYDYRDATEGGEVIIWLNNVEKDKRYEGWPSSIQAVNPHPSFGMSPIL